MTANFPLMWQPPAIVPLDPQIESTVRARIDDKAKPPGSLGRIEDLATQLGMIRHPGEPRGDNAVLLVFAADHGLVAEGVSQYPAAVTVGMVMTYLAGRATANAFAAAADVEVRVIDAGVAAELPAHPRLIDAKIRMGTANAAREPAMTPQQAADALAWGSRIAVGEIRNGADIIALGEMGIGNTASSALLVHRLAPAGLDDCIGVGAGQDDSGMARKRAAIEKAAARSDAMAPFEVLCEFGGLEIAMMAGAVLGAASQRRPVVIDGFISTAAALLAVRLCPAARGYCVFAHRSAERGHDIVLAALDAKPLLDLGLRLGEGTGALLAVPLVRAAARMLTDVASLDDVMAGNI
ncbi:MAG: Nicotinate-nucleotide-dimethylbenzimidazole phosphoribosyltransferase [Tardiphaga sp.]|uniref:nicotinate-nucleotide--dimethylbenzimidazole phosphoribosyltransferase n=1 Tax=Tardiphaga sp. TaxID=1926292 RepID=UPI00260CB765|nr:nicotinate-nucleotide--dimethylbenzimidazole phosphoribosyltransferase [Tardiphaga sp.]MDB5503017.1 Nicotinate-nucleotide-dimethylbenzimidazole phosphoribosyltransferase [Tardiphaga sp.]